MRNDARERNTCAADFQLKKRPWCFWPTGPLWDTSLGSPAKPAEAALGAPRALVLLACSYRKRGRFIVN